MIRKQLTSGMLSKPVNISAKRLTFLLLVVLVPSACVTPAEERQIKDDIALLQSRLLEVENNTTEKGRTISNRSNQHAASTNARLDKIERELQKIKGEIDTLRVGVITGQMPGIASENEGSVAKSLEAIRDRLQGLEDAQKSVQDAIERIGKKKKSAKASSKKSRKRITSLKDLQGAFDDKRFAHVVEDGAQVVKKQKKASNKEKAMFLYAEGLYKIGRLRDAALKFNEYLEMKPSSKLAHAKMRMGDCFRHLGDSTTAKIYYEELMSKHAGSSEAKTAKERLEKL